MNTLKFAFIYNVCQRYNRGFFKHHDTEPETMKKERERRGRIQKIETTISLLHVFMLICMFCYYGENCFFETFTRFTMKYDLKMSFWLLEIRDFHLPLCLSISQLCGQWYPTVFQSSFLQLCCFIK